MSNLTLNLDEKAEEEIAKLKKHYHASSKADVIRKGLALLRIASEIDKTDGELIARKGEKESRIVMR